MPRSCGTCSLCCRLLAVPGVTDKDIWCRHAGPGRGGCAIYNERPGPCREFACLWLLDETWGAYWKPDKCKIVIEVKVGDSETVGVICFHVDPEYPLRWQQDPWWHDIQTIAAAGREGRQGKRWVTVVQVQDKQVVV